MAASAHAKVSEHSITRAVRRFAAPQVQGELLQWVPWRAEDNLIFACLDDLGKESIHDKHLGQMLTSQLAQEAVQAHNSMLQRLASEEASES